MTPQFTDEQKRGKRCTGKARAAERVLKRILTFAEQRRWNEAGCDARFLDGNSERR